MIPFHRAVTTHRAAVEARQNSTRVSLLPQPSKVASLRVRVSRSRVPPLKLEKIRERLLRRRKMRTKTKKGANFSKHRVAVVHFVMPLASRRKSSRLMFRLMCLRSLGPTSTRLRIRRRRLYQVRSRRASPLCCSAKTLRGLCTSCFRQNEGESRVVKSSLPTQPFTITESRSLEGPNASLRQIHRLGA